MSKKASRILWLALAVLVLAAAGAGLWASAMIRDFLRSEKFRTLISAKTGEALRAEAAYAPLRWQGDSVFSDSLQASGTPGSIVEKFQASQIRAEVNWRAILDGAWRVDRVEVVDFEGSFRPGSTEKPPDTAAAPAPPSFLAAWLPKRFELGTLNIARARLGFRSPDGREIVALADSAIQLHPDGSGWAIEGNAGTLALPNLPSLNVVSFRSRIQEGTFFLTDAALRLGEAGKITASGEFADNSKLNAQWEQVDVAAFLAPAWRERLTGLLAGTVAMEWPPAGLAAGKAEGTFRLTDGLVQNVTVLDQIATFTGAPQFRRMPLQEFSGNFQWQGQALALTNLVAESKGLLRVEGGCVIAAGGSVAGTLRVGVTPQTLQWLPGSRERVFTVAQNGYLWTDVRIAGTLQNLQEDLSARLVNAMRDEVIHQGAQVIENLPGAVKGGAGVIENLPGAAKDGARGVLEVLTPLIP